MSEKKFYKIIVYSTFYEAPKKRDGTLGRPQKKTRQQTYGEIEVETLSDALDIFANAIHLAIKEYGDRDRYELKYQLAFISEKCKTCGAWTRSPRMLIDGYYDGELYTATVNNIRKHYFEFETIANALKTATYTEKVEE